jgi:hypothetical protein
MDQEQCFPLGADGTSTKEVVGQDLSNPSRSGAY